MHNYYCNCLFSDLPNTVTLTQTVTHNPCPICLSRSYQSPDTLSNVNDMVKFKTANKIPDTNSDNLTVTVS